VRPGLRLGDSHSLIGGQGGVIVDLAGARKKEDLLMIVRDETSSREDDDGVDNP